MEARLALLTLGVLALQAGMTLLVNKHVPQPYMDEVFHVPQTQRYCAGRWAEWDPKITTFPGLYAAGVALGRAAAALQRPAPEQPLCGAATLRWVNVLASAACVPLFHSLAAALDLRRSPAQLLGLSAAAALFPLHFFFGSLYYTDVLGVLATLACLLAALRRRPYAAAALGAAAIGVRQTNAVWVAYAAGVSALEQVWPPTDGSGSSRRRPGKGKAAGQGAWSPWLLARRAWAQRGPLAAQHAGLGAVLAAFAAFVVANGGVVVGDRSNHAPALHAAQLLYFCAYAAGALAPAVLTRARLASAARALRRPSVQAGAAAATALAAATAHRFTVVHPFLLADNRHLVFYLWRRTLGAAWWARYAAAPAYVAAAALLAGCGTAARRAPGRQALFWGCAAAALTPAPLLELRYFSLPALLLLLGCDAPGAGRLAGLVACYAAVDAAAAALFLGRPFAWPDGSVARFMW